MSREKYKATIGLEIHAELNTRTKMFCGCLHDTDEERPNINICPICMGHPGTLPMINKQAVKNVLKVGLAVGGKLADYTEFDRKNYFYPDIPKGYQISQYKYPLVSSGNLNGVALTRIHLEEDTAKSMHDDKKGSLVNFNRAGAPLMELVTEPVIKSATEAGAFARELQLLLQYLKVSNANMEKGEMRVEANVSVSQTEKFGTKVEVKNLNSFRAVEKAIEFEIDRQISLLESGQSVRQETRGWDENKSTTFLQRVKEDSHDYRYFPDPDLPKMTLSQIPDFSLEKLNLEMPELPWQARSRLKSMGLEMGEKEIETLVSQPKLLATFDEAVFEQTKEVAKTISGMIITEIHSFCEGDFASLSGKRIRDIALLKHKGLLSSRGVKDLLRLCHRDDNDVESIARSAGIIQQSDRGAIDAIVKKVLDSNPKVVSEYKAGKSASMQFLIGQAMKESRGTANPAMLKEVFEKALQ